MDLGARISAYLKANGIKQAFLVEKTGLSAGKISDICTGNRKTIGAVEYFMICQALNVDMMKFLSDGKEIEA